MRKSLLWHHLPVRRRRSRPRSPPRSACAGRRAAAVPCAASPIPSGARGSCNPSLDHLHDPFMLADMRRGGRAARARDRAAASGSRSTATTTSTASPRRSSCAARSSCSAATSCTSSPNGCATATACSRRRSIGCTPRACALIVSVDCGIRGTEAALRARELGVDLIITDHHEPDGDAAAGARGDQSRSGTTARYPDKHLAGVGVALEAGAGALRARRQGTAGCRRS